MLSEFKAPGKFLLSGIAGLLLILLPSCGGNKSTSVEFDTIVYRPEYASGFTIKGAEGKESTLLEVTNPWQGAYSVEARLLIARGGEPVPDGFDGQVIEGDAKRIVTMSSTHVAMLDALGEADRVAGVSGKQYISSENILRRTDSVGDVGFEGNVNYELLASLEPDIVLLYGVNGASSMEGKLRELGIPYMYIGDYVEESPLGKAEWLVAVSEIIGRRERGERIFQEIPARYEAVRKKVADAGLPSPSVMINTPYNDSWFMPSTQSYMVRLISDAGGDYLYDKNTGTTSEAIDMEEAYLLASKADVWLNPGMAQSLADVRSMAPKFTDTPVMKNGAVYNNNRRVTAAGGNDFYESAVVAPDAVLRDLVKIFHPELAEEDFVYYRKLE